MPGVSSSTYYEWKKHPGRVLDVDRLTRISYLVGIYKALHILYGNELADEWVTLPNTNVIFGGRTPLEYMAGGGLLALQTVRRLLDARRGGVEQPAPAPAPLRQADTVAHAREPDDDSVITGPPFARTSSSSFSASS